MEVKVAIEMNLSMWISEMIEGCLGQLLNDTTVLECNVHVSKQIVFGFRLANDMERLTC